MLDEVSAASIPHSILDKNYGKKHVRTIYLCNPLFSSWGQSDLSTPANHAPAPAEIAAPMGVKAG
jgi:hypothetical protein